MSISRELYESLFEDIDIDDNTFLRTIAPTHYEIYQFLAAHPENAYSAMEIKDNAGANRITRRDRSVYLLRYELVVIMLEVMHSFSILYCVYNPNDMKIYYGLRENIDEGRIRAMRILQSRYGFQL